MQRRALALRSLLRELSTITNSAASVQEPPCLKANKITFGSFNQSRKITPRTASHWMAVLNTSTKLQIIVKSKNLGEEVERTNG